MPEKLGAYQEQKGGETGWENMETTGQEDVEIIPLDEGDMVAESSDFRTEMLKSLENRIKSGLGDVFEKSSYPELSKGEGLDFAFRYYTNPESLAEGVKDKKDFEERRGKLTMLGAASRVADVFMSESGVSENIAKYKKIKIENAMAEKLGINPNLLTM